MNIYEFIQQNKDQIFDIEFLQKDDGYLITFKVLNSDSVVFEEHNHNHIWHFIVAEFQGFVRFIDTEKHSFGLFRGLKNE